jgi:hypothetical protein
MTLPCVPSLAGGGELAVFDARRAALPERITLTALQGIVNRDAPRLYLLQRADDQEWAGLYQRLLGTKQVRVNGRGDLLRRFKTRLKGYVVWDPAAPATANLATTLAGLDDLLPVPPDLEAEAKALGLACRTDFRGQFAGDDPLAAYAWAAEHLWPRCMPGLAGQIPPSEPPPVTADVGSRLSPTGHLYLRLEDAVPGDEHAAVLHKLTLDWSDQAGPPQMPERIDPRVIAFRAGGDAEVPYLLDPDGSALDRQGDRAVQGEQHALYRFLLPAGAPARLTLRVYGQYVLRISGRPDGSYQPLARSERPGARPSQAVRDLLVARRAPVFDLSPEEPRQAALRKQLRAEATHVLSTGPPNLSVHRHAARRVLGTLAKDTLAVPVATYAAAEMSHRGGAPVTDPQATTPRAYAARPGKDEPNSHVVYGPYVTLPPGRYAVAWRLKVVGRRPEGPMAALDIADIRDDGRVYARRTLKGADFAEADRYQWFVLTADVQEQARLEYRVKWQGGGELRADRIVVWSLGRGRQ